MQTGCGEWIHGKSLHREVKILGVVGEVDADGVRLFPFVLVEKLVAG